MKMLASTRPIGDTTAPATVREIVANDYDQAYDDATNNVPPGELLIFVRVVSDNDA